MTAERRVALQDAIKACEDELIEVKDGFDEYLHGDYNNTVFNCIRAIQSLLDKDPVPATV